MSQSVVFYVSGHGFGHASRDIEVINALLARRPDLDIHVRTYAPRWLFDLTVRGRVHYEHVQCDTGVLQRDTLNPDIEATVSATRAFYEQFDARATAEAAVLRELSPSLVLADLPPVAFAAAALADVPAVAIGNFTWDWIYDGYARWFDGAGWIAPLIRDAHRFAEEAWRLPMHGGFAGFRRVIDLPFVARRSTRSAKEVRRRLGLDGSEPVVLVSFGGFGLESVGEDALARLDGYRFIVTEGSLVPKGERAAGHATTVHRNVVSVNEHAWYGEGYRYEDLVKTADVVVTKPGFGIIAESIANDAAVVYTSRGPFAEYDVLVTEMPKYLRCAFLSNEDLLAYRWQPAMEAVLSAPPPPERADLDGADFAADRALSYLV
jgi:UDP:flavonoid glycosyltransferase YjiC (YdhE family)